MTERIIGFFLLALGWWLVTGLTMNYCDSPINAMILSGIVVGLISAAGILISKGNT